MCLQMHNLGAVLIKRLNVRLFDLVPVILHRILTLILLIADAMLNDQLFLIVSFSSITEFSAFCCSKGSTLSSFCDLHNQPFC